MAPLGGANQVYINTIVIICGSPLKFTFFFFLIQQYPFTNLNGEHMHMKKYTLSLITFPIIHVQLTMCI